MSSYWPDRPSPKGFSIEKLAKNYREKILRISSGNLSSNPIELDLRNTLMIDKNKTINRSHKDSHWANRRFYEYIDVA